MKVPPALLLVLGTVAVFTAAATALQAMGIESATLACFMAAVVATFLTAALL
jgi:hypothetical protein